MNNLVTLCMIIKNDPEEAEMARVCIGTVFQYVDHIEITVTCEKDKTINAEIENIFTGYKDKINFSRFTWINDFSAARNFNMEQSKTELIMWLDADDLVVGAETIPKVVKSFEENENINSIWAMYDYDHDKDGNCINKFPRERIFKKSIHKWMGKLHENAMCKFRPNGLITNKFYVKHDVDYDELRVKASRNFNVIAQAYKDEKEAGKLDPRTVYDLARSFDAIGKHEQAENYFAEFLKLTQSHQDHYDATIRICEIRILRGSIHGARTAAQMAMATNYDWPDAYIILGKCAFIEQIWDEALHWFAIAKDLKTPFGLPYNPLRYTFEVMKFEQNCLFWLNKAKESLELIEKALKMVPSDESLQLDKKRNIAFLNQMRAEDGANTILDWLKKDNQEDKIQYFLKGLPDAIKDLPKFVKEYNKLNPIEGKDRLVIYCGSTIEKWGPDSVETGIGGSEEATICAARELVKLGWKVEVYTKVTKVGVYDGVKWNHVDQYDNTQPCDVFIAWRMIEYIDIAPEGSLKILWLHDVQKTSYYQPRLLEKVDKIFCLSQYHRNTLFEFPDELFYITRNGIDPEQFAGYKDIPVESKVGIYRKEKIIRDPNEYIYASSPDRGLEYILKNWDKIKKINPKAVLHIFYGFTEVYDRLSEGDIGRRKFKEDIMALIDKLEDVNYHGRVGHQELADWFMRCGYWLYPTDFPEISCITAMKAQAAGCIPITNNFAALDETLKYGYRVSGKPGDKGFMDEWLLQLKDSIKYVPDNVLRKEMRTWALEHFAWSTVALDWSDKFKEWRKDNGSKEKKGNDKPKEKKTRRTT